MLTWYYFFQFYIDKGFKRSLLFKTSKKWNIEFLVQKFSKFKILAEIQNIWHIYAAVRKYVSSKTKVLYNKRKSLHTEKIFGQKEKFI